MCAGGQRPEAGGAHAAGVGGAPRERAPGRPPQLVAGHQGVRPRGARARRAGGVPHDAQGACQARHVLLFCLHHRVRGPAPSPHCTAPRSRRGAIHSESGQAMQRGHDGGGGRGCGNHGDAEIPVEPPPPPPGPCLWSRRKPDVPTEPAGPSTSATLACARAAPTPRAAGGADVPALTALVEPG